MTRLSFLAYGDSRGANEPGVPGDGQVVHVEHTRLMDFALAKIEALATTPYPVRFVLHTGDAVLRGANAAMWNVSFTPIIERLSRRAGLPFFSPPAITTCPACRWVIPAARQVCATR